MSAFLQETYVLMVCQDLKLHSIQVKGRLCPLLLNNTINVLANKEMLVRNMKLKGSFGCSDHEMVVFKVNPWAVRKASASSLPWITREQTLASTGNFLVEHDEIKP